MNDTVELKLKLEALQQEYAKAKRYLEWSNILSVYCRNEDISADLNPLLSSLKAQVEKLEREIPILAVKLKIVDKKLTKTSKKEKVRINPSKEKDFQSVENLKFHYENHNREKESPLLYHPGLGIIITKSANQLAKYQASLNDIIIKGRTLNVKDSPTIKETALLQQTNLSIDQIKDKLKSLDLGFSLDVNLLDFKFCLIIGRI